MNKDILVVGNGFIGNIIEHELECKATGCRIYSYKDVEILLGAFRPKIIINCIGVTGKPNVDGCEERKDDVLLANSFVPILLAEAAIRHKFKLVHISSGCIFHYDCRENVPLRETDRPDFYDLFYSRSKIYAESAIVGMCKDANILIPRIRVPLLNYPHPRNVIDKLIEFKNFTDIPNSVTYIPDFIKALKHLLSIDARGVYNVVNEGGLRWPELMDVYKKYVPDYEYGVIPLKERGTVRTDLLLSTEKLRRTGFPVRDINSILDECISEYVRGNNG